MTNPFAFKYPPIFVDWFSALSERLRQTPTGLADEFAATEKMVKSGERIREGFVRSISFSDRGQFFPYSEKCICLNLTANGFCVRETLRDQGVRSAFVRFAWSDIESGVCRHYIEDEVGRRKELLELRRVVDLKSWLDGLAIDRLATAAVEVKEFRRFHVVRNEAELRRILSDGLASGGFSCRLQSRDGAVRVKVSSGAEHDALVVLNELTGEESKYASASDVSSSILPGLFIKGLLFYDSPSSIAQP